MTRRRMPPCSEGRVWISRLGGAGWVSKSGESEMGLGGHEIEVDSGMEDNMGIVMGVFMMN